MPLSLQQAREELSQRLGDTHPDGPTGASTAAGAAGGSTLIDSRLSRWPDTELVGMFIVLPGVGRQVGPITTFTSSTGACTVTPSFSATVASGVAYELHAINPFLKHDALNQAAYSLRGKLFRLIIDAGTVTAKDTWQYTVPSTIDRLSRIELQVDPNFADYPYRQLARGADWDWYDDGKKIVQFKRQLPFNTAAGQALHLRFIGTAPLNTVTADGDTFEGADKALTQEEKELLYAQAAVYLYRGLLFKGRFSEGRDISPSLAYWQEELKRMSNKIYRTQPSDVYLMA